MKNVKVKDVGDDGVERQIVQHQPDTEWKIPANLRFSAVLLSAHSICVTQNDGAP